MGKRIEDMHRRFTAYRAYVELYGYDQAVKRCRRDAKRMDKVGEGICLVGVVSFGLSLSVAILNVYYGFPRVPLLLFALLCIIAGFLISYLGHASFMTDAEVDVEAIARNDSAAKATGAEEERRREALRILDAFNAKR